MNYKVSSALAGVLLLLAMAAAAQKVDFTEYDLPNGLHVILHKDNSAPVVAVTVLYYVGAKNEDTARTGFAHFFEHLLFEGSTNIKRGEFQKFVSSNGGETNANTTQDRTFYFEVFPSNQLETGLWLESERMLHPVINDIGVNTRPHHPDLKSSRLAAQIIRSGLSGETLRHVCKTHHGSKRILNQLQRLLCPGQLDLS